MKQLYLIFLFCIPTLLLAQTGGQHVFTSLQFSPSARITGLGGNLIPVKDGFVASAFQNPALLNEEMHQALSFDHQFFVGGIQHGLVSYGHYLPKEAITTFAGVRYVNYGEFTETDEFNNKLGTFKASDVAVVLGASKQLYEKLSVGINAKFIQGSLSAYESFGIAFDLAAHYQDTSGLFSATLVFQNAGFQVTPFVDSKERLPFDIQFGIAKRLRYLPFRLTVIATNLQRWNVLYDDPDAEEEPLFFGEEASTEPSAFSKGVDNFFRHLIFGGEFLFGQKENFVLRFGYNHRLRQEMSVDGLRGTEGFSFGFGIKISKFRLDYGHRFFHRSGSENHIGIATRLSEFTR